MVVPSEIVFVVLVITSCCYMAFFICYFWPVASICQYQRLRGTRQALRNRDPFLKGQCHCQWTTNSREPIQQIEQIEIPPQQETIVGKDEKTFAIPKYKPLIFNR